LTLFLKDSTLNIRRNDYVMAKDTLIEWDNCTLNYDTSRFDFREWIISVVQEVKPEVTELETMHKIVSPEELYKIKNHFHKACLRTEFMEMLDAFMAQYVPERICNKEYLIQRYPTLRIMEPNQAKKSRRLFIHKGVWAGNGEGLRTIWMPFTKAWDTNTLQILPLDISHELSKKCFDNCWSLDELEGECWKHSFPVNIDYGQAHLFSQHHLHGNVNNETDITRVGMDVRVLVKGEPYLQRLPGAWLRFPGDYQSDSKKDYSGKYFITYDAWVSNYTRNIPLPMQRSLIDDYCQKNKISYADQKAENAGMDWCPALQHFIKQKPEGLVMLSIYALPDKKEWRDNILNLALENNVELHFANEYLVLKDKDDLKLIEDYLTFSPA